MLRLEHLRQDDNQARIDLVDDEGEKMVQSSIVVYHDGSDLFIRVHRYDESSTGSVKLEVL